MRWSNGETRASPGLRQTMERVRRIKPKAVDGALALPSGIFNFARQVSDRSQVWLYAGSVASFFLTLALLEFQRRIVNEALEERNVEALALSAQVKYELVANAIARVEEKVDRAPVAADGVPRAVADTGIA